MSLGAFITEPSALGIQTFIVSILHMNILRQSYVLSLSTVQVVTTKKSMFLTTIRKALLAIEALSTTTSQQSTPPTKPWKINIPRRRKSTHNLITLPNQLHALTNFNNLARELMAHDKARPGGLDAPECMKFAGSVSMHSHLLPWYYELETGHTSHKGPYNWSSR